MTDAPIHPGFLDGLDRHQLEAVTDPATPMRIIAGAGSGKTRVLTRRIAHSVQRGAADANHVVAVTFTRRAALELRRRLNSLGLRDDVTAGTFHSLAWAQLHDLWDERNIRAPELIERPTRTIAKLMPAALRDHAGEVAAEISWAGARAIEPDGLAEARRITGRDAKLPAETVAAVWRDYAETKRVGRLIDFDDVLRLATAAVMGDEDHARTLRWRWRHFFVDEFQDLNRRQLRLLRAWLGDRSDLCVVGDPRQAIYSWNGADARYLTRLDEMLPGLTTIELGTNHRSSAQVVACGHAVVSPHGGIPPTASSGPGPIPVVHRYDNDQSEATHLARRIRDRHRPSEPWSIQAVLVRTHAQAAPIVTALSRARIPHRLRGTRALLARPAVARWLRDDGSARRPLVEALRDLTDDVAALSRDGDEEAAADLGLIAELASEHLIGDPDATVAAFAALLRAGAEPDLAPGSTDAVDVVTFHSAKGLEWPIVHIAGLEVGFCPISHARTDAQLEEERRLVHVAITRAERELHLSWAANRRFGDHTVERRRSPYLDDVDRALARMGVGAATADRGAVRRARRRMDERVAATETAPTPSSAILEELIDWRSRVARGADVAAGAVIDDGALAAIARAMPDTTETLATVAGLGAPRLRRLGPAILEIVERHR
ncbi:MAG: ATP-dependent DNA helicase UvrD2 [Acidimicrobiales bacterium]